MTEPLVLRKTRWFEENGLPKKGILITAAVLAYLLYPVILAFETIGLLHVKLVNYTKNPLAFICAVGLPLLFWFFFSVTLLVWIVKREVKAHPNFQATRKAVYIVGNYLVCQLVLLPFTMIACIILMVRFSSKRSLYTAGAEIALILWQIALILYFDAYRVSLKKRIGAGAATYSVPEAGKRQETAFVAEVDANRLPRGDNNDGLPNYEDVVATQITKGSDK